MQIKKQQLELDMEQQTGSKLGKEYVKAVYCHPAYLTICRVHHEKRWAEGSTSWNQDCIKLVLVVDVSPKKRELGQRESWTSY